MRFGVDGPKDSHQQPHPRFSGDEAPATMCFVARQDVEVLAINRRPPDQTSITSCKCHSTTSTLSTSEPSSAPLQTNVSCYRAHPAITIFLEIACRTPSLPLTMSTRVQQGGRPGGSRFAQFKLVLLGMSSSIFHGRM